MTASIVENEYKRSGIYSKPQSMVSLNSLSKFLANFDVVERTNKQEYAHSIDLSSMVSSWTKI